MSQNWLSGSDRGEGGRKIALYLWAVLGGTLLLFVALASRADRASAHPLPVATPTPTPGLPLRQYDPPAPTNLVLAAEAPQVHAAQPGGYPRIVKLWGGYDARVGIDFYAQYDLFISVAFNDAQLRYLRQMNPGMILLYSGIGTYDEDTGPLGSQWVDAVPDTDTYDCFYRGTDGQILRVGFWGHGMFNMSNDWCTDVVADHLVSQFDPELYDGVFFDRVTQKITPAILDGIDVDHDGHVDNRAQVNEAYWRGTERFLDLVRQRLADDLYIVANDAPLVYTNRLHGREYESFIRGILDSGGNWASFRYNYEQWTQASLRPPLTMVMANPPTWLETKYGLRPYAKMKPAVVDDAASWYQRMRFGLASALMEDGLYSFEFGTTWHGNAWWYDEFDGAGLGKGYLGAPLGDAYYATGPLSTPNLVQNGEFEVANEAPWQLALQDAEASWSAVPITGGHPSAVAARIMVSSTTASEGVRLEQGALSLLASQPYMLSFWGRASEQLWDIRTTLYAGMEPGLLLGLNKALQLGTTWQQYWVPFTATVDSGDAVLSLAVGARQGVVWIDEVRLQQGILPEVFRRDFEHGTVLCNATRAQQVIPLQRIYRKLAGTQAPLTKILIDDSVESTAAFVKIEGWAGHSAGDDDWGWTYHHALTTQDPSGVLSAVVYRPSIAYADQYTVSAWIAPHSAYTDVVTYTVQHADGTSQVPVYPVVSEPKWLDLGTYFFEVGTAGCVTLTNLSRSTWVVADAVKFESVARYNDGSEVSSVTLEGQDGIILLRSPPRIHLPLVTR